MTAREDYPLLAWMEGFAAECGCGWASGWYLTSAEALAAYEMHQVVHR